MRRIPRVAYRFSAVWAFEALSLLAMALIVHGISFDAADWGDVATKAMAAALILALLNTIVRPFIIFIALPINMITLGFFSLVISGAMLLLTSRVLPFFIIDGWGSAVLGTLVLVAANAFLTSLTTISDDYSFFDGVVQWLGKRRRESLGPEPGRGLVVLEIDGLSLDRTKRAIAEGRMPTVHRMLEEGTHELSMFDCGLPSQTSSCQAGIMYGENSDIPAFRWYEKDRGRLMCSSNFRDAAEMNARYARGQGLLRGGSSVSNHMAGDARRTLLTMSTIADRPPEMETRSYGDLNLFFVNPYIFPRTFILTLWDALVELGQALRQRLLRVQPRVNRLHKGYPLVRAGSNIFLRELATFMVIMDVIRGVPAIYTTWVGYDEVAHHAGPDTRDAMNTLKGFDRQVKRILDVINRKAPRPYDIIILSDHGQSPGATFLQRYGRTLAEVIEGLLENRATATEVNATENSYGHAVKLLAEIEGMERSGEVGRVRGAAMRPVRKAFQRGLRDTEPSVGMDAQVIVCASGNLANVYFNLSVDKVSIDELNTAYPQLIEGLVSHAGVGFVVGYAADGTPLAMGSSGARNLVTGAVSGTDPLAPYGDTGLRAGQLLYLAQFPHSGDMIVNSAVWEDGQVAAFEELVGSHGGLGGQQTEAFLLHPADMAVPPTSNSAEVFALLDARRDLPGAPLTHYAAPQVDAWDHRNLLAGVRAGRTWLRLAGRALRLRAGAFREVADDTYTTGPALIILLVAAVLWGLNDVPLRDAAGSPLAKFAWGVTGILASWLAMALSAYAAGRLLRGKGDLTRVMRALAFAQMPIIAGSLLHHVPVAGPYLSLTAFVAMLVASWIALKEALGLRPVLAVLVPVLGLLVFFAASTLVAAMIGGLDLVIEALLLQFGITR